VFSGKTIFPQVIELIHPQQFRRCVERYRGHYKLRAFSCWDQFLCMAFAQLTFRESLRDIEDCPLAFHKITPGESAGARFEPSDWR
jgi:hypothetical protein